jgi:ADP-ribose pyrophosphatase
MNDNNKKLKKKLKAKAIFSERVYDGYFSLDRHVIEVDRHAGGKMQVERLMLERGDSVVILAYDPRTDQVLMVEQFSAGAFVSGDKPFGLTLPAGSINKGEDLIAAARRELKEEAALEAQALHVIHAGAYTSAGSSSERAALVLAVVDMRKAGGVHGVPGENEDIKSVILDAADFIAQAERGQLRDLTSMVAAFHLARTRLQLRKAFNIAAKGRKATSVPPLRIKRNRFLA